MITHADRRSDEKKDPNVIHPLSSNQNESDGARFCALQDEDVPDVSFFSVLRLNIPEWPYIFVGTFCAMINGAMQPVFAILFSKIITVGSSHSPHAGIFNWSNNFYFSLFFFHCRCLQIRTLNLSEKRRNSFLLCL